MRRNTPFLIALALLTGCGDMNRAATEYIPSADRLATAGNDELPPLSPATAARDTGNPRPASGGTATTAAPLRPLGRSTLEGETRLTPHGTMSSVSVALVGGVSHGTYQGAVREGSCPLLGAMVAPLVPVTTGPTGSGRAESYLPLPADSLRRQPHVIVYGPGGRAETCGEVGRSRSESGSPEGGAEDTAR